MYLLTSFYFLSIISPIYANARECFIRNEMIDSVLGLAVYLSAIYTCLSISNLHKLITPLILWLYFSSYFYSCYCACIFVQLLATLFFLFQLHAISCGLKALSSSDASAGIEICRLACGGHGYLSSSNLPRIYTTTTAAITYEGENTVMWLQVARLVICILSCIVFLACFGYIKEGDVIFLILSIICYYVFSHFYKKTKSMAYWYLLLKTCHSIIKW